MVFFKSLYKAAVIAVFFGFFFLIASTVFGLNFWPRFALSPESLLVLFLFILLIVLSADY